MITKLENERGKIVRKKRLEREKERREIEIKSRRDSIRKIFPELLHIDSEQKAKDYIENKNCYKCQNLIYESSMEDIKNMGISTDLTWRFSFSNEEKSCYCCHSIGNPYMKSMVKIENPKQSYCSTYELNREISTYIGLIYQKYQAIRQAEEYRKSEIARIEEELRVAEEKAKREKEEMRV